MKSVCPKCFVINRIADDKLGQKPLCGKCGTLVLSGIPTPLKLDHFSRFIDGNDMPVLVCFWASWCGPCKTMIPVLDQVSRELITKFRIGKINTEEEPVLAQRFNIRSTPTLVLFKKGVEWDRLLGAVPLEQLQNWLVPHL